MNPTQTIDHLNKKIECLQAVIQVSDGLSESAANKQVELLEKLTGLVKELTDQNALQAKQIATQNARLAQLESRQTAQEQAKINQDNIAHQVKQRQMNAENSRKKEELNDLAFKAYRAYEDAQQCIDSLINSGCFSVNAGSNCLYPEGHFMNTFYRGASKNSLGNVRYIYNCYDKAQIPFLTTQRDYYKQLYDNFDKQRNAIP